MIQLDYQLQDPDRHQLFGELREELHLPDLLVHHFYRQLQELFGTSEWLTDLINRTHLIGSFNRLHPYEMKYRERCSALYSLRNSPDDHAYSIKLMEIIEHRADHLKMESELITIAESTPGCDVIQELTDAEKYVDLVLRRGPKTYMPEEWQDVDACAFSPKRYKLKRVLPEFLTAMIQPSIELPGPTDITCPVFAHAEYGPQVLLMITADFTRMKANRTPSVFEPDDFNVKWTITCPGCQRNCPMFIGFREVKSLKLLLENTTNRIAFSRHGGIHQYLITVRKIVRLAAEWTKFHIGQRPNLRQLKFSLGIRPADPLPATSEDISNGGNLSIE